MAMKHEHPPLPHEGTETVREEAKGESRVTAESLEVVRAEEGVEVARRTILDRLFRRDPDSTAERAEEHARRCLEKLAGAVQAQEGWRIRENYEHILAASIPEDVRESLKAEADALIEESTNALQQAALNDIQATLGDELHWYGNRDEFVRRRDWWVARGVIDAEAVNSLPEVKEAAALALCQGLVHPAYDTDIDRYIERRDEWVSAGVFTEEEANALPLIRNKAYKELSSVRSAARAQRMKEDWVRAGVVSDEEAEEWLS